MLAALLGSKVDTQVVQKGKLYSILSVDGCMHGLNGGPAILNSLGPGKNGAYAEYIITFAATQVKRGDKVLIFGIGGLGHLALQSMLFWCNCVCLRSATDLKPAAHKLGLELGATEAFDLIELTNKTSTGFKVDKTIDFVANNQTFNLAMAALQGNQVNFPSSPTLVLVCTSIPARKHMSTEPHFMLVQALRTSSSTILDHRVGFHGSSYGPRSALVAVLDLFANGTVRVSHVHSEPLENVNKVIDELRAFEITGRKVVIPYSNV
ncbi:hypothetical protein B0H19DRAFT_1264437 [Mycena capillaripes]|nr:hypothetical protein B0H19DRAFT_1277774 [Mycena capillaripes]KAJ6551803.1 hypothetical protein B0H19DRAFT_1264437 [Mycena capillaripes]